MDNTIICIFLSSLLLIGCSSERREVVLERYDSGSKYIVAIYEGEGTDEQLIERRFYQESGKLGRIEDVLNDSTISYEELYPEISTSEGLREFLQGEWLGYRVIRYDDFSAVESYHFAFDGNTLTRTLAPRFCGVTSKWADQFPWLESEVKYLDDLEIQESNLRLGLAGLEDYWADQLESTGASRSDFEMSLIVALGERSFEVDQTSALGRLATLSGIAIPSESLGDSFRPLHGSLEDYDFDVLEPIFSEQNIGAYMEDFIMERNDDIVAHGCGPADI